MGLDAEIYVVGDKPITQEELDAFNEFMKFRVWPDGDWEILTYYPYGAMKEHKIQAWWKSLMRYYGPGYTRGPWPALYVVIEALRRKFPDHEVVYTHDCGDGYGDAVTDEDLKDMWELYFSDSGDSYRKAL